MKIDVIKENLDLDIRVQVNFSEVLLSLSSSSSARWAFSVPSSAQPYEL
jgi:hypothetical protein